MDSKYFFKKSLVRGWAKRALLVLLLLVVAAVLVLSLVIWRSKIDWGWLKKVTKAESPLPASAVSFSIEDQEAWVESAPPVVPPIRSSATDSAPAARPFVPPFEPGTAAPLVAPFVLPIASGSTNPVPAARPFVPPIGAGPEERPLSVAPTVPAPKPSALTEELQKQIQVAVMAYTRGDLAAARESISEVDLVKAGSAPAWEVAGLLKERDGDNKAAGNFYSQGITLTPTAGLYYRRAALRRADRDLPRSLEDLERAVLLAPGNPVFSNERLLLLIQMGRTVQAGKEMKVLSDRGGSAEGWVFGFCGMALEKGDYAQAARLLARAQQIFAPETFAQLLKNPVIVRHQGRPEILPFFFTNLAP